MTTNKVKSLAMKGDVHGLLLFSAFFLDLAEFIVELLVQTHTRT